MESNKFLSIVIPVYNDQEVLRELYNRLKPVINDMTSKYEIVFVDDGSKDGSFNIIRELQFIDRNIKAVKLTRNFGQANSITAGLDNADGEIIILMDSDLQDRPEDIPKLVESLIENDVSMAIAKWITREDSYLKKLISRIFYKVSNSITNIHHEPNMGVFRAIRREVIDEIERIPEKTGSTLSLMYWLGYDYVAVDLKRDARFAGKSGYNIRKMLKLSADRIFSYSVLPIRAATIIGFFLSILSFIAGIVLTIKKLIFNNTLAGWTSITVLILFLFGVNFVFLGVIGEYLGRIYLETKDRPKYIIDKLIKSNYADKE